MHWLLWAFIACIVFMVTYNPRSGRLSRFLDLSQSEKPSQDSESATQV